MTTCFALNNVNRSGNTEIATCRRKT